VPKNKASPPKFKVGGENCLIELGKIETFYYHMPEPPQPPPQQLVRNSIALKNTHHNVILIIPSL